MSSRLGRAAERGAPLGEARRDESMSNRPEDDPIGHAAKFLWILALIPVIFGSMVFFLPSDFAPDAGGWKQALPFVFALLIAAVGLGVWKRIAVAAWAGVGLFGVALVALGAVALTGESKKRGMMFFALMLIWPIRKLFDSLAAMRREAGGPPPG